MNPKRASITSLIAGIAIGFVMYPELLRTDPIHPDPREQAANAYLCGVIGDEERVQREILHDGDAVRSPECDPSQRRTEAYLCGEIANEERVQRDDFQDADAAALPECDPSQWGAQARPIGWTGIERLPPWLSGRWKVSPDQPKSIASTP